MSPNDFSSLPTKEHLTHTSYFQHLRIILEFGLRSLDIPLTFQLQSMRNNPIPFKEKAVAKAGMADHGWIKTRYHLETRYLSGFLYRKYSLCPRTEVLVDWKMLERRAAGMIQKVWNVFWRGYNQVHQALPSGKEMTEGGCGKRTTKS